MAVQSVVWVIWLIGTALIALAFLWIAMQAAKPADDVARDGAARTGYVLRKWFFGLLLTVFLVGSWATLHRFPIPHQSAASGAAQTVDVVAHMWYWELSTSTLQADSDVEFRVTSADVNHGFAIYSPDGHIVTQTQAMPGYTNKLIHTFSRPGTYTIQCLEYCGMGHAPMKTTFEVVAAGGE